MELVIDDAEMIMDGVWTAQLSSSELRFLKREKRTGPGRSVILINEGRYQKDVGKLFFRPDEAVVAEIGTEPYAIFIASRYQEGTENSDPQETEKDYKSESYHSFAPRGSGDRDFIAETMGLPKDLRIAGNGLLATVRKNIPGDLKRFPRRRYVETPDNFWAITIQPQAKSFLITLRGNPDHYDDINGIKIQRDRNGYSAFKLRDIDQVKESAELILMAQMLS